MAAQATDTVVVDGKPGQGEPERDQRFIGDFRPQQIKRAIERLRARNGLTIGQHRTDRLIFGRPAIKQIPVQCSKSHNAEDSPPSLRLAPREHTPPPQWRGGEREGFA